jgi:hypothetical protein
LEEEEEEEGVGRKEWELGCKCLISEETASKGPIATMFLL